jgi:two-component system phosphate regulon sensor histidine kinase PhoR
MASEDKKDFITLKITDTGPGIPKSELPRLGERFYRVDKMRSRDLGGTGLGLSIVKHLMKAHEGEMQIDSTPGRGTVVSLKFPIFQKTS